MDSKGSTSFLAVVAASVLSLAATAGEDEVLLDVATNYAQNVSHARCLTTAEAKKTVDEVFAKTPVYQKAGRAERVKRLIDDGMATLVRYEADRERGDAESADKSLKRKTVYKLFKKWMETELPEDDYGGKARIHDRLGAGTDGDEVAVYADGTIETSYGWLPEGDFINLIGAAESLELAAGDMDSPARRMPASSILCAPLTTSTCASGRSGAGSVRFAGSAFPRFTTR